MALPLEIENLERSPAALGASGLPPLGARRGASRNRAQLTNADACLLFHKVRPAVPRAD